ncbi:FtsX-like permease family protein [Apibacter sp. ESL0432]|uniref:ABC transporter permease n=1 Tax=Apibacter sp. ESL0432 TaxID=2704652 RepID=UPI001C69A398|nr:ABC transporter permease [Apibacter sp. ESL0432]QYN49049.1 FtsX-like permease family protein [Apibacter sp. ESL0432]
MFNIDRWQEIFYSIKQNKLRTFLSGFTISLGLFIFIILFGFGNGLKNGFSQAFILDSSSTINIIPGKAIEAYLGLQQNRDVTLKNEDLELVKKEFDENLEFKTATITQPENVTYRTSSGIYTVQATYPDKQYIEKAIITSGRFLNQSDIINKTKFAVIGRLVEKDLFKNEKALGKYINIGGINYKVVGIFYDEGGDNDERIIYIPISTLQSLKKNTDHVSQIDVAYLSDMKPSVAVKLGDEIERTLRSKLKISPTDKTGLVIRNRAQNMEDTYSFFTVISSLVMFIGFGTIMAGIIGISNIMVYIVKERTKEIGIRKALGAKPFSIVWLILQESIFITVISGISGVILGSLALYFIGNNLSTYLIVDPSVSKELLIFATVSLITFGTVAGFIPARKAAKIKPIEALSSD